RAAGGDGGPASGDRGGGPRDVDARIGTVELQRSDRQLPTAARDRPDWSADTPQCRGRWRPAVTASRPAGVAGRRLLRAAALIAAITAVARVAGFGRTVVFGRTVGGGCVGGVYQTANTIPNIIFDIVAGGTLAALVVPLLAPAFVGRGRQIAAQTLS